MKKFTLLFSTMLIACFVFGQTFQANHKILNFNTHHSSSSSVKAVVDTLHWCTEYCPTGLGLNAAGTLGMAAEFKTADLTAVNGDYITKIRVNIANATVITSGKVGILTGTLTGSPVIAYQQAATFVSGWNEIILTVPYQINSATPIFIACEVTVTGGYPLGFDAGPANANTQADWISTGGFSTGWLHAASVPLNYNAGIKGVVDDSPTTIAMTATPTDVYFIGYVGAGATASETAIVQSVGLTSTIAVTATTGFEVSSNNTTFAATATLPTTGGNLYIRYIPEAAFGQTTGTATLTSTGVPNVVVNLTGLTYDCQGTITAPYTEDFYTSQKAGCWTVIDANADANTFILYYSDATNTDLAYIYPYSSTSAANDWLISPQLTIPSNPVSSFQYKVSTATYPEKYEVYVITGSPTNYASGTQIVTTQTVTNTTFATQALNLAAYAGQNVYIGIKCVSAADMDLLYIDNFILDIGSSVAINNINAISVFPNPTSGQLTIFNAPNSTVEVYNLVGKLVYSANNVMSNVDLSSLTNGSYIVKVTTNDGVYNEKINIVK